MRDTVLLPFNKNDKLNNTYSINNKLTKKY